MSILTKLTEDVESLTFLPTVHQNIFKSNSFQELVLILRKTYREALEINLNQLSSQNDGNEMKKTSAILSQIRNCLYFITGKLGKHNNAYFLNTNIKKPKTNFFQ